MDIVLLFLGNTLAPLEEIPLIGEMSAELTKGLPFSPEKAVAKGD
jgi:hypothetical protein